MSLKSLKSKTFSKHIYNTGYGYSTASTPGGSTPTVAPGYGGTHGGIGGMSLSP